MFNWDDIKPIDKYETDWVEISDKTKPTLTAVFDNLFGWINDTINDRFITIDQERTNMLKEDPSLNIKNMDDGFNLEVERLNAIQQQSSKGFQVIDINPGLLNSLDNPLTLPYEFLFDGTNFIPDQNQNFVKNFRSVNIPIAGNFLKVEFIYENNSTANLGNIPVPSGYPSRIVPAAAIKYSEAFPGPSGELDLVTGQNTYTFDNFARNKVYVDFGASTGKPHLVPTSGRYFKTYFNEVNISLNIGAPKIRITIGFNSEVYDTSNSSAINAKLALTGSGRILNDSDTTLNPFCISDMDIENTGTPASAAGIFLVTGPAPISFQNQVLSNYGYVQGVSPSFVQQSYGYSVVWITRIYANVVLSDYTQLKVFDYFRMFIDVASITTPIFPNQQSLRVHNAKISSTGEGYVFEPEEPIRVVIPAGSCMRVGFSTFTTNANSAYISYAIDGYSYGEILVLPNAIFNFLITSKFITDSTFLSNFNRINNLKDF